MNFMLANSDTLELHPNDPRRSDFYYDPAPASIQHKRFVALRQLISSDIPCILWGPDAMYYSRFFPAIPCDQQILVPDDLVESAATLLEQKEFRRVQMSRFSMENPFDEANPGAAAFPDAIRLQHADISDSTGPYGRSPLPGCVLLIPQSYYDVDFRSTSRFQLLDEEVIQLDALNGKILVPKFHTFLEAVVYIIFNPPTGFQHQTSLSEHEIWLERILRYRVKEDPDLETNPNRRTRKSDLRPAECEIIAEIQNADCAWYIHKYLWEISFPIDKDVDEYKQHKALSSPGIHKKDCVNAPSMLPNSPRMQAIPRRAFSGSSNISFKRHYSTNHTLSMQRRPFRMAAPVIRPLSLFHSLSSMRRVVRNLK